MRNEINEPSKLRCCRYLRKSRDDARSESLEETLSRHSKITKAMADDAGLEIQETYQEVVSGSSISERPEMRRLLNDLKDRKWDIVVVVDISRLSRGDGSDQTIICNAFRLTGTLCLSDWRTYNLSKRDDLELFEKKLQSSHDEYKAITHRLQRGVVETVKDGYSWGGTAPYGLKRIGNKKEKVYVPSENFDNLKLIFEYPHVSSNPSWNGLRKMLHDLGIRSPRGHEWWSKETLKNLFRTPAYIGDVEYGRRVTKSELGEHFEELKKREIDNNPYRRKARWEPFFDPDYVKTGLLLLTGTSTSGTTSKACNPLKGLLVCGKCGHAMAYSSVTNKGKSRYYLHSQYLAKQGKCWCREISTSRLIDALLETLIADSVEYNEIINCSSGASILKKAKDQVARLKKRKASISSAKFSAYDRLERRIIDETMFSELNERFRVEEAAVEKELEEAERNLDNLVSSDFCKTKLVNTKEAIRILKSEHLTPQERNRALKLVIDRIDYFNDSQKWSKSKDGVKLIVHLR